VEERKGIIICVDLPQLIPNAPQTRGLGQNALLIDDYTTPVSATTSAAARPPPALSAGRGGRAE
jgi:hypothetical protein